MNKQLAMNLIGAITGNRSPVLQDLVNVNAPASDTYGKDDEILIVRVKGSGTSAGQITGTLNSISGNEPMPVFEKATTEGGSFDTGEDVYVMATHIDFGASGTFTLNGWKYKKV